MNSGMIYICRTEEVSAGKPFVHTLRPGEQIVVFRGEDGYYAVENRCPHAGARLNEGEVDGNILTCIWHGWQFDLESGHSLDEYWVRVKTYPLIIKENRIYLDRPAEPAG